MASAQYAVGLLDYSGKASSQNKKVSSRKMQKPTGQANLPSGAQSIAQVTPSAAAGTSKKR